MAAMAARNAAPPAVDEHDESVRIAIKALGDMRNGGGRPSSSLTSSPSGVIRSEDPYHHAGHHHQQAQQQQQYHHHHHHNPTPSLSTISSASSYSTLHSPSIATTISTIDSPIVAPSVVGTSSSSDDVNSPQFVHRVSHLPLVNTALRAYEKGKASSSVVKYGAEMMESSVMTISSRLPLPVNVNVLDEFACRQLDRFDRYRRPSHSSASRPQSMNMQVDDEEEDEDRDRMMTRDDEFFQHDEREWSRKRRIESEKKVPVWLKSTQAAASSSSSSSYLPQRPYSPSASSTYSHSHSIPPRTRSPSLSRSSTPQPQRLTLEEEEERQRRQQQQQGLLHLEQHHDQEDQQIAAPRSRWHSVLLEAGGFSAALSEESMKRLKYCLQWLQYATAHIDAQILVLRDFTAHLQPLPPSPTTTGTMQSPTSSARDYHPTPGASSSSSSSSASASASRDDEDLQRQISQAHLRKLTTIRKDLIHTIRQVVDVVSKYAGGALPEPARSRVRGFILTLPKRWANANGVKVEGVVGSAGGGGGDVDVDGSSLSPSPSTPTPMSGGGGGTTGRERDRDREERKVVVAAASAGAGGSAGGGMRRRRGVHGLGAIRGIGGGAASSEYGSEGVGGGGSSVPGSPVPAPATRDGDSSTSPGASASSPTTPTSALAGGGGMIMGRETAMVAAQRILTLATESLDMMRGVTGVVKDSLDRAEEWVGRLAVVGVGAGAGVGTMRDAPEGGSDVLDGLGGREGGDGDREDGRGGGYEMLPPPRSLRERSPSPSSRPSSSMMRMRTGTPTQGMDVDREE